jgi:hypothetical protein
MVRSVVRQVCFVADIFEGASLLSLTLKMAYGVAVQSNSMLAVQCFTYMVAFGASAAWLTCLTHTWALKHSEEQPGIVFVSKVLGCTPA